MDKYDHPIGVWFKYPDTEDGGTVYEARYVACHVCSGDDPTCDCCGGAGKLMSFRPPQHVATQIIKNLVSPKSGKKR